MTTNLDERVRLVQHIAMMRGTLDAVEIALRDVDSPIGVDIAQNVVGQATTIALTISRADAYRHMQHETEVQYGYVRVDLNRKDVETIIDAKKSSYPMNGYDVECHQSLMHDIRDAFYESKASSGRKPVVFAEYLKQAQTATFASGRRPR